MALLLELKVGEILPLAEGHIKISLVEKSGQQARLKIEAPKTIHIGKPYSVLPMPTKEPGSEV